MRDTIDMAREAGFETMFRKGKIHGFDRDGDYTEELKAFEALVRADEREAWARIEREACANAAEDFLTSGRLPWVAAAAIRARGNT